MAKKKAKRPIPKKKRSTRGKKLVIYGPPGSGKTSLASYGFTPPGTEATVGFVVDSQEEGILDLMEYGQVNDLPSENILTVDHWKDGTEGLLYAVDQLGTTKGITDIVIDSLTGMEKLCHMHHCEEYFDGDWSKQGFMSYYQGPRQAAKKDWPTFLDVCDDVAQSGYQCLSDCSLGSQK